jgi:hypothetical protein
MADTSEAIDPAEVSRINCALTTRNALALANLVDAVGLNKTDIVNRAIGLYWYITENVEQGSELAFIRPGGSVQSWRIL